MEQPPCWNGKNKRNNNRMPAGEDSVFGTFFMALCRALLSLIAHFYRTCAARSRHTKIQIQIQRYNKTWCVGGEGHMLPGELALLQPSARPMPASLSAMVRQQLIGLNTVALNFSAPATVLLPPTPRTFPGVLGGIEDQGSEGDGSRDQ